MNKDLAVLRRFNRRVTRTEQSGFWKRYAYQIPNVISRMEKVSLKETGSTNFVLEGIIHSSLDDFDQDEIAAFVLDYRQYTQNNDAISISSLARIYDRSWMHAGAMRNFKQIRKRFNRELNAPSSIAFGNDAMSVRELVDIVVYGGLAHSSPQKAEIFEAWEKSGIMGLIWAEFFAAMRDLMQALKQLRTLDEQLLVVADPASPSTHLPQ